MPIPVIPPIGFPTPGVDRLGLILLAIQAQLEATLDWGVERVPLVDPAKLTFHPHGDSYVCVWPDTELADRGVYQGAGRVDFRMKRKIYVNARSRTPLDFATDSTVWLTDPDLGHGFLEVSIWDGLVEFMPLDGGGNQLSVTALAPVGAGKPRLDPAEKEWGESALAFEVIYQPALALPPY